MAAKKKKATKGTELEQIKSRLAELVPQVWETNRAFAIQSGIENDETFEECLGEPCEESDIAALEKLRKGALPPSYRAFLMLYSRWNGFCGGADALGAKDHRTKFIKEVVEETSELFDEFEGEDPLSKGAYPFAIGDDRSFVLIEPAKSKERRNRGEMDFVEYYITKEEGRYPDLVALLEHRLASTAKMIKKPKKAATKLGGILEKLAKTRSTANGFDLRVKWKGANLESVEIRSNKNGEAVAELVKLDAAHSVTTLILGGDDNFEDAVRAMAKNAWPKDVERLSLGNQRWGEQIPGLIKLGDPAPALNQYKKLKWLDLTPGSAKIGKLAIPTVKELTVRGCSEQQCKALAAADWPNLERLTLFVGYDKDLARVLSSRLLRAPKLTDLGIKLIYDRTLPFVAKALAASASTKKLKKLRVVVNEGDEYLEERLRDALEKEKAPKLTLALASDEDETGG